MKILLSYHDNRAGSSCDAGIITEVLEAAGATLSHLPVEPPGFLARCHAKLDRWRGAPRFDATISLEQLRTGWLPFGRRSFLIPNQEWFEPPWARHLSKFRLVLCKTREAERLFGALGARVAYIGFTSRDRRLPKASRRDGVLHVAGRSLQKGTGALIRAWLRHPEWPTLTVVQRPPHPGHRLWHPSAPNIRYLSEYLPDEEVRLLQNTIGLHACPSEAEGFGHVLVESLSCGAILITTDAPPMDELVRPDRGILVPYSSTAPQGVGTRYLVDEPALERALAQALALPPEQREQLGQRGREWFEDNDRAFRARLTEVLFGALSQR